MGKGRARKEEKEARESRLQQAIASDDVAEVHKLIAEERELLDHVSKHPFPNTPLHLAAAAGKTQVAMEMAILRPSFARKLNVEGYSPMYLALQHGNYPTVRALMTIDTELIRVRGRLGKTPLHYVAEKGGDNELELLELLAEFLCACKSSIEDLTSRCETAVHIAVKNHNLEAFKILLGWLERVYLTEILYWKDENGNNVLHIAKSEEQKEIVTLLDAYDEERVKNAATLLKWSVKMIPQNFAKMAKLLKGYVKVIAKNFQGRTAQEISQENPHSNKDRAEKSRPSLSEFLRGKRTMTEKYAILLGYRNKSAREMVLLVATLTATATYQAALTPPGGYWQDDSSNPLANSTVVTANSSGIAFEKPHKAGKLILSGKDLYKFAFLNSIVFLASILTIWMTAIALLPHTFMIYGLTLSIGVAYLSTLTTGILNSEEVGTSLLSLFYFILLMVGVIVPILSWVKHQIDLCRIDATWRRVGSSLQLNDE